MMPGMTEPLSEDLVPPPKPGVGFEPAQIRIVRKDLIGATEVNVNGVDVARHVKRLAITMTGTQLTSVVLDVFAGVELEGPGIVHVVAEADAPSQRELRDGILSFVDSLDWQQVMQNALQDEGTVMSAGPGEALKKTVAAEAARQMEA
jgi:hypothetical protein